MDGGAVLLGIPSGYVLLRGRSPSACLACPWSLGVRLAVQAPLTRFHHGGGHHRAWAPSRASSFSRRTDQRPDELVLNLVGLDVPVLADDV